MKTWSLPEEMSPLSHECAVPIGLTQDGENIVYDGRRLPYLSVLAADVETLDAYLSGLCGFFDVHGLSYKVIDGARVITQYDSPHILCAPEDMELVVLKLEELLPVCDYFIIVGIAQTLESLSKGGEAKLVDYIINGCVVNRPITIIASELWRYEAMGHVELRRFLSSQRRGLWVGHSVRDCPFYIPDGLNNDWTRSKEPWLGFLFVGGNVHIAHVLGTRQSEHAGLDAGGKPILPESSPELRAGTVIGGRYAVVAKLGEGGAHSVWLVRDVRLETTWAMKTPRSAHSPESLSHANQSLINEARLIASLSHPATPRVIDIVEYESLTCVILEHLRGVPLNALVRSQGAIDELLCARIGIELCEVLSYLHNHQPPYIHGDVKPANVVLREEGGVALIDFSTARRVDVPCAWTSATIRYAAPEIFSDKVPNDVRLDIYSVGVLLYVLATGEKPINAKAGLRPLRVVRPQASRGLEHVVMRATAQSPGDRYPTVGELLEDLLAYAPAGWEFAQTAFRQDRRLSANDGLWTPYIDDDQSTCIFLTADHGFM